MCETRESFGYLQSTVVFGVEMKSVMHVKISIPMWGYEVLGGGGVARGGVGDGG